MMKYLTSEKIGPNRSRTPEGFLLCHDVPIARTGLQIYGPGETPVNPGPDGIVRVERLPEDVFREETIASFNGKPVVNDHPNEDVTPDNWRDVAVGVVLHPHRGTGVDDDVMFGDLLIQDAAAIAAIEDGKREVSCGYDAEYIVLDAQQGRAKQTLIIGNHVALVDAGRCGSRCSIGDQAVKPTTDCSCNSEEEITTMTWKEKLLKAIKGKDESAAVALLEEVPDDGKTAAGTNVHLHLTRDADKEDDKADDKDDKTKDKVMDAIAQDVKDIKGSVDAIDARLKKVEDAKKDDDKDDDDDYTEDEKIEFGAEAPPGTNDRAWAKDSAVFADSFQETLATAEIIAPGIHAPTFDGKAVPRKTFDALCAFRKKVLDAADRDPATHVLIDSITRGRTLDKMRCSDVRTLFHVVGTAKRNENNRALTASTSVADRTVFGGGTGVRGTVKTIAELNKKNSEHYKG